ncbi:helix-turn-helix domain-containing protein [Enterococcus casseliflavus]|uniref:helix-turn-helix domain-containing protein n=1 Tax=Enterococcus casseliflavus TaxID=37734 RepID=UPI001432B4D0|nr:helix-turn-helix domain-containing protein [Enterococcus casseliflavus]NKD34133.1 helix-turn-helix domain-containing protein [Enterococcus casseliflavus]
MKTTTQVLKNFYQATGVPLYHYRHGMLIDHFLPSEMLIAPNQQQLAAFVTSAKTIDYLATNFFAYFGRISIDPSSNNYVIVGPILQLPFTRETYANAEKAYVVPEEDKESFNTFASGLPLMPLSQFLNNLRSLYFFLTGHETSSEEILRERDQVYQIETTITNTYESKENNQYNNSYDIENLLCSYVENGQVEKIAQFIESPFQIHDGKLADSQLRQIKNTAIVSITLITRAAIRGGVDTEIAFQISDSFIRQIERLLSFENIQQLMQEILFVLTKRVQEIQQRYSNQEFNALIRYIQKNINQPLSVAGLAEVFGYSRGYLSSRFKAVNQVSLQAFIQECKIREAKQLLAYTDKPLALISNYLCFSSQSHFQTVFKKQTDQSPLQYRKQMKKGGRFE